MVQPEKDLVTPPAERIPRQQSNQDKRGPALLHTVSNTVLKHQGRLTTTAEILFTPRNMNLLGDRTMTTAWKITIAHDISPAERCTARKAVNETPKISARKLICGPRNKGIKFISERLPARRPACIMVGTGVWNTRQKELATMYARLIIMSALVHGPINRCR